MIHPYIAPAWDLALINGIKWGICIHITSSLPSSRSAESVSQRKASSIFIWWTRTLWTSSQRYSIGYESISLPYKILVWDMSSRIISILIMWKWLAHDSLWISSWQIGMLLVRWIYRPILGRSSYPRCNSRSHHIRQLRSYQTNIAWWLPCSTYLWGTIKQQVRVHILW